jgi:hypothetical protein
MTSAPAGRPQGRAVPALHAALRRPAAPFCRAPPKPRSRGFPLYLKPFTSANGFAKPRDPCDAVVAEW